MAVYGPHCEHGECAWSMCDYDTPGVKWGCREQAKCSLCGPASEDWDRIATEWIAWAVQWAGASDSATLRARGVPANVIATAELVEAHPPKATAA